MSEINEQILESLAEPEIAQFPDFCAAIVGLVLENKKLRTERYQLAYAICGGEDAPGYLDSIDVETIAKVCRDNYLLWSKQTDKNIRLEAENERLRKALVDLLIQALQSDANCTSNEWGRDAIKKAVSALGEEAKP